MVFLYVVELLVVSLVFVVFLFQVIMPMWNGTQLFPSFRSKTRELERQLRQARSELELSQDQKKLQELKGKSDGDDESKKSV